jgi:hypothetical protein
MFASCLDVAGLRSEIPIGNDVFAPDWSPLVFDKKQIRGIQVSYIVL